MRMNHYHLNNSSIKQWTVWIAEINSQDKFFKWSVHTDKLSAEDDASDIQRSGKIVAQVTMHE